MQRLAERASRIRMLSTALIAVCFWVLAGFALADPELSPNAFLGGAKALFVFMAIGMTLWAAYRFNRGRRTQD